jgi:hypothetical protein
VLNENLPFVSMKSLLRRALIKNALNGGNQVGGLVDLLTQFVNGAVPISKSDIEKALEILVNLQQQPHGAVPNLAVPNPSKLPEISETSQDLTQTPGNLKETALDSKLEEFVEMTKTPEDSKMPAENGKLKKVKKTKKSRLYGDDELDIRKSATRSHLTTKQRLHALLNTATCDTSGLTNSARLCYSKWAKPVRECYHYCHDSSEDSFLAANETIRPKFASDTKFVCPGCSSRKLKVKVSGPESEN